MDQSPHQVTLPPFNNQVLLKCSGDYHTTMDKSHLSFRHMRILTVGILTFRHRRLSTFLCCSSTLFPRHTRLLPFQILCIDVCCMLVAFSLTNVFFSFLQAIKPFHKKFFSSESLVLDNCCSKVRQLYVSLPVFRVMLPNIRVERFCVLPHQLFLYMNLTTWNMSSP